MVTTVIESNKLQKLLHKSLVRKTFEQLRLVTQQPQHTCKKWGLNPQPLDHHSNTLPTELGRNLLGMRFLK